MRILNLWTERCDTIMSFSNMTIQAFSVMLASKAATPGGGGASALVGAIGTALGSMVGNLTVGKKKYAHVEADIYAAMEKLEAIRADLLELIDRDAEAFEPLSKAYSIPKDAPNRPEIMEAALKAAAAVPMDIMRTVCRAIELHGELCEKGSMLALSDVGVGVTCCRAALVGASLNVFINTKSLSDRTYARDLESEANSMLTKYCALADSISARVITRMRGE